MMNKPFKGISVPLATPERTPYKNGKYPKVGDLVTKEIAKEISARLYSQSAKKLISETPQFRKVTGVVVSITSGFSDEFQMPLVQWSEFDTKPVAVYPGRIKLVKRG